MRIELARSWFRFCWRQLLILRWIATASCLFGSAGLVQATDLGDDFSPDSLSPYDITGADTAGDVWIGISNSGVLLRILGGGSLTLYPEPITNNGTSFFVGIDTANNSSSVTGSSAVSQALLSVMNDIVIGLNDASDNNQMTMGVWSSVSAGRLILGLNDNSQNNTLVASGSSGSLALTSDLVIGFLGDDNGMTVDLGRSVSVGGHVYIGFDAKATGNSLTVTGAGSALVSAQEMLLGFGGSTNALNVLAGGQVVNRHTYIGFLSGANGNIATVSGSDSLWRTNGVFYLSYDSDNNQVAVNTGGQVVVGAGAGVTNTFSVTAGGALRISTGRTGIISGNYLQNSLGTFHIDATDATTFGKLNVTGVATLEDGSIINVTATNCGGIPIGSVLAGVITASSVSNGAINVLDNCPGIALVAVRNGSAIDLLAVDSRPVPTLTEWGMLILVVLLGILAQARLGGCWPVSGAPKSNAQA